MKKLTEHLITLVILTSTLSVQAQARTWAFSKDTVYENRSGTDTMTTNGQNYYFWYTNKVMIANQGSVPLIIDSFYIERIQADYAGMEFHFAAYDSTKNGQLAPTWAGHVYYSGTGSCPSIGKCTTSLMAGATSIEVQANRNLYDFSIDVPPGLAKRTATAAMGDTLCYRMIFTAKNGRGRDTLIVRGTQDKPNPSSVLPGLRDSKISEIQGRLFDLRGRRVERIQEGVKAPWAPLVSPKE